MTSLFQKNFSGGALKFFFLFSLLVSCSPGDVGISKKEPFRNEEIPFDQYLENAKGHITINRSFVTKDQKTEILYNSPFEKKESCFDGSKGILLVHGILDSPGYMRDVGSFFAKNCFLVRAILLDGAGTHPSHMHEVELEDWIEAVKFRFSELEKEVDQVFLGGFSLGGGLTTHFTLTNPDSVKGLFLIAPSLELFKSQELSALVGVPFLSFFKDYIGFVEREKNPAKYHSFSLKALSNLMNLHAKIRREKRTKTIKTPTFFVFSHDDPVVPTKNILLHASKNFINEKNEALVFVKPSLEAEYAVSSVKTSFLTSYFPEKKIESFAHTSLSFSPSNPLYGEEGEYSFCVETSATTEEGFKKCLNNKDLVTFGARNDDDLRSVLTYNPHFEEMMDRVITFFNSN